MARRLRKPLMPWQQHVADVALEIDPETGQLFYEEIIVTVPRQSGKTTLLIALMVWRCVMFARRLELESGLYDARQRVTYLAQTAKMARRKLIQEVIPTMHKSEGFTEVKHSRARPVKPTDYKPSTNNGSEHILFGTQSLIQIEAPTETASHGDVLDMPVIDEAFAREDDLVEQAVDAATVTRKSPQTCIISTAGNSRSVFLWRKVLAGRRLCQTPNPKSRTAYFEWSVPDSEPYDDPATWADYLPALGHTITVDRLQSRLVKALANPDEPDEEGYEPGLPGFLRGYLNQWVDPPQLGGVQKPSEIDPGAWMADTLVDPASQIVGPKVVGVGVGKDGVSASLVVAGRRSDGLPHIETLIRESGVWWLERRLRDMVEQHGAMVVAWDNGGDARPMAPDIQRALTAGHDVKALPITGREWAASCEAFKITVTEGRLRHLGDLLLLDAVSGAFAIKTGDGWRWDTRDARADITPLLAATAALRALETLVVAEPQEFYVY